MQTQSNLEIHSVLKLGMFASIWCLHNRIVQIEKKDDHTSESSTTLKAPRNEYFNKNHFCAHEKLISEKTDRCNFLIFFTNMVQAYG